MNKCKALCLYLERLFGEGSRDYADLHGLYKSNVESTQDSTQVRSSILTDRPWTDPIFVRTADLDGRSRHMDMVPDTLYLKSYFLVKKE